MKDQVKNPITTREDFEAWRDEVNKVIERVKEMIWEQIGRGAYPLEIQGGMATDKMHAMITFSGKSHFPISITINLNETPIREEEEEE